MLLLAIAVLETVALSQPPRDAGLLQRIVLASVLVALLLMAAPLFEALRTRMSTFDPRTGEGSLMAEIHGETRWIFTLEPADAVRAALTVILAVTALFGMSARLVDRVQPRLCIAVALALLFAWTRGGAIGR